MQSSRTLLKTGVVCLLLALIAGCNRSDTEPDVTPEVACRVQKATSPDEVTAYTYDGAGRTATGSFSYVSGTTFLDVYQYDADGFVTQLQTTQKTSSGDFKSTTTYQYESGRLTKKTRINSSAQDTDSYSYDAGGKLTRHESPYATYSFTNGLLTSAVDKGSGKPYTITNGRIAKAFVFKNGNQDVYIIAEYNAAGQLAKEYLGDANGVNLNINDTNAYEYTTQSLKAPSPPALKGHPVIELYGKEGYISRIVSTAPNANKARDYTVDYQYKTNSKGYITELTRTRTGYQPSQQKTVYTFINCQ